MISTRLQRFGSTISGQRGTSGDGWADVMDTLSMYPDVRRKVVRLLAEIDAIN